MKQTKLTVPVFDLPQLYQKPTTNALIHALNLLTLEPSSFANDDVERAKVHPEGVTTYLTKIISSPLSWIEHDEEREAVLNQASHCLAQRSGRTAMGDMTRVFPTLTSYGTVDIILNEPGLTGDDLGLKTWSSSFELAKILYTLELPTPTSSTVTGQFVDEPAVLELGAGTGLVGLAAAAAWSTSVLLTDLPEIVPNLTRNLNDNSNTLAAHGGMARSGILDWTKPETFLLQAGGLRNTETKFQTILAADPIYSPQHPRLLVQAAAYWLQKSETARLILAYPVRQAYAPQIVELLDLLGMAGLEKLEERIVRGRDDWKDEVVHVISVWRWRELAGGEVKRGGYA